MNKLKLIGGGIVLFVVTIVFYMMVGINNSGQRTVIQYPSGTVKVKFTEGWYLTWFGKTTEYNDVITFDFDKLDSEEEATLDQKGISVRYQDGGTGTVYGLARFRLPEDELTMVKLHKSFRSFNGVAHKLIRATTEEANNLTAGLMSSEAAYAEQRGTYINWSREQLDRGRYITTTEEVIVEEEGTGKRVNKTVPKIKIGDDGQTEHAESDFSEYGITIDGYKITDWDFEGKTLDQIAAKREATMAIITSKAEAERAKQESITAEEQGKKEVTVAKYEKEVEKQKAVTEAEQKSEVAEIEAKQRVLVAEQELLEQTQKKLTADEYKQEQTLRGEGDAAYKRAVVEADGALEEKLKAWVAVNTQYAAAISAQKWVPETQIISGGGGEGQKGNTAAQDLLNMLMIKTAKDISLDTTIVDPTSTQ